MEATEQEYLRKCSKEERLVHQFTDEGMEAMKSLRLDLANKCFDKVFEVRPNAYLWQAGIVKFYLNDIKGAADIFARSASHFETKFGPMGMGPASEERIWRNAVELKYVYSLRKNARKQFLLDKQEGKATPIAQISDNDESGDDEMGSETRMVHRLARELFDASVDQKIPVEVVARAKLLSFAGNDGKQQLTPTSSSGSGVSKDIKKRKLNACYFLALHYDVTGDKEESKKWIKVAFKLCTNAAGKSADIMDTLPLLHMTVRDWFDDDPYDDEDDEEFIGLDDFFAQDGVVGTNGDFGMDDSKSNNNSNADDSSTTTTTKSAEGKPKPSGTTKDEEHDQHNKNNKSRKHMSDAYSDPVLEASIMEDVGKMKFDEIREALRIRGISATGSKETLKERLFISLMDDAGYQSGFAP